MKLRDEQFATVVKSADDEGAVWFDVFWVNYASNSPDGGALKSLSFRGTNVPTLESAMDYVADMHGSSRIAWVQGGAGDVWSAFEIDGFH